MNPPDPPRGFLGPGAAGVARAPSPFAQGRNRPFTPPVRENPYAVTASRERIYALAKQNGDTVEFVGLAGSITDRSPKRKSENAFPPAIACPRPYKRQSSGDASPFNARQKSPTSILSLGGLHPGPPPPMPQLPVAAAPSAMECDDSYGHYVYMEDDHAANSSSSFPAFGR